MRGAAFAAAGLRGGRRPRSGRPRRTRRAAALQRSRRCRRVLRRALPLRAVCCGRGTRVHVYREFGKQPGREEGGFAQAQLGPTIHRRGVSFCKRPRPSVSGLAPL